MNYKGEIEISGYSPVFDCVADELGLFTAAVFGVIWRHCQMYRGVCDASQDTLAQKLGTTRQSVNKHIDKLLKAGFVKDLTPELIGSPHTYQDISGIRIQRKESVTREGVKEIDSEKTEPVKKVYRGCKAPLHKETSIIQEENKELGADALESNDSPYVEIETTEGDLESDCPRCGERIIYRNLRRNQALCPHCDIGLYIYDMDGVAVFKPPQGKRKASGPRRVLSDLMPCQDAWANIPYYARDRSAFKLLYDAARDDLVSAIGWAVGEYAKGKMAYNKIVSCAIKATQKRLRVTSAAQSQGKGWSLDE